MSDLEKIKIDVKEIDSRANNCWYDIKILARAVLLILEEMTRKPETFVADGIRYYKIADRKTESNSEKPNNSTISKMEQVDKDINVRSKDERQTDDLQDWKDRMWAEAIVTEPQTMVYPQVDGITPSVIEPQTYITEDRDTQILDAWQVHHRSTTSVEDEPQKIGYCNECKWFGDKQVCGICRSKHLYVPKDEPQKERSE